MLRESCNFRFSNEENSNGISYLNLCLHRQLLLPSLISFDPSSLPLPLPLPLPMDLIMFVSFILMQERERDFELEFEFGSFHLFIKSKAYGRLAQSQQQIETKIMRCEISRCHTFVHLELGLQKKMNISYT